MIESKKGENPINSMILKVGTTVLIFLLLGLFCQIMGYPLVLPVLILFIGLHLYFTKRFNSSLLSQLGLLLTLIIFITNIIIVYTDWSHYFIPVALIAMLAMLLYNDLSVSFIMAFLSSLIVTIILGGDFSMMLIFFLGGLTGAYAVKDARTRGQLFAAGLFVSGLQVILLFLIYWNTALLRTYQFEIKYVWPLALNGFITILIVSATLKIFEYLFGRLTNFSLLELSDFNQPLLKRMILEAPGTYHHSLVVSNLAEAAADSIGANALLTRVGAYYHDIGKMKNPEYFTENQMMGANKHDQIEPTMSRLVILNHVKEGVELAKKNKLNQKIIDFIPQHHGTSLIFYFYQKSLEDSNKEKGESLSEENFRYPGPKPQTRETAITLLADSVEGATRALDEPSPTNIEKTVKKVVNNRFIDGQLDECPLTLKEIDRISATFIRILSAMYHARIKYPEAKNDNNNKKQTKENQVKFPTDLSDRKENPSP